jgi:hypothetical protein
MHSKSLLITGACVAAVALCTPTAAFAASKKSASPAPSASPAAAATASPAEKPARAIPFRGTATSVDQSAKSFVIAGKINSRTFKATDKTTITKDDKAASFSDLSDNHKVTGSYWKQADGTLELKSLKIGAATEAKKSDTAATAASPSPSAKKK